MNELTTVKAELPDNLPDLSKFVIVGRERLNAVRAEIRAIEKVGLAKEVHEQKLQEAQEIAEAVLDAEAKIGELTSKMEQAKGARTDIKPMDNGVPKSKQLEQIGINEKQKQRFETLASHPETVEKAKAEARAEGRIVTRQDVLNRIAEPTKSKHQFMKDFKQQVRDEHDNFASSSGEKIVSMKDIQRDKQNVEVIVSDVSSTIIKALSAILPITLIKQKDFELMREHITDPERQRMIEQAHAYINIVSNLIRKLGG